MVLSFPVTRFCFDRIPMAELVASERTLPHNLDAEKSVLGAILINNDAFNHAAELIDAHDFFRDAHRRIFNGMVALSERNDAIDFVTLREELARTGQLDEVGGPAYIASLADGVPRSANVEYYARIVKEKATLRNLIHSANKILSEAYQAEQEPAQEGHRQALGQELGRGSRGHDRREGRPSGHAVLLASVGGSRSRISRRRAPTVAKRAIRRMDRSVAAVCPRRE